MLPVSEHLHHNMQGLRYLRGFYVLGGSYHDVPISSNVVRIICVVAHALFQRLTHDDEANADSHVNQHVNSKNTRLIAFSLPVVESDGACLITRDCDSGAPLYKYLKTRS